MKGNELLLLLAVVYALTQQQQKEQQPQASRFGPAPSPAPANDQLAASIGTIADVIGRVATSLGDAIARAPTPPQAQGRAGIVGPGGQVTWTTTV